MSPLEIAGKRAGNAARKTSQSYKNTVDKIVLFNDKTGGTMHTRTHQCPVKI